MKKSAALVSLIAAMIPLVWAPAGATAVPHERKYCTRVELRAGSRMASRRVCLTASQWREALGPAWREQLTSSRNLQQDYDALMMRSHLADNPAGERRGH